METLQHALGYRFRNPDLALQALRHASVGGASGTDNERLEFLGDALLGLTVAEMLYGKFPNAREGELTERRARVVSRAHLGALGRVLGLDALVELRPPTAPGARVQESVLAGTLEALLGAVYLDGGLASATVVTHHLLARLPASSEQQNPKTELQHWTQVRHGRTPVYRLVEEREHAFGRTFCVQAEVEGRRFGSGWGRSKREAEQNAAREALLVLRAEREPAEHTDAEPASS
ncbi:MAG: ribonuclease III [Planctomycetes bacterium]|nr:ribonuclease III [Planctomycetota bacterium]